LEKKRHCTDEAAQCVWDGEKEKPKCNAIPTVSPTEPPTQSPTPSPTIGFRCSDIDVKADCKANEDCKWDKGVCGEKEPTPAPTPGCDTEKNNKKKKTCHKTKGCKYDKKKKLCEGTPLPPWEPIYCTTEGAVISNQYYEGKAKKSKKKDKIGNLCECETFCMDKAKSPKKLPKGIYFKDKTCYCLTKKPGALVSGDVAEGTQYIDVKAAQALVE